MAKDEDDNKEGEDGNDKREEEDENDSREEEDEKKLRGAMAKDEDDNREGEDENDSREEEDENDSWEEEDDENDSWEEEEERNINEEYKIYQFKRLNWPSVTVDWLPGEFEGEFEGHSVQRLILGTHTYSEPNYLMLAQVLIPENEAESDPQLQVNPGDKVKIIQRILHSGEVNRARHMPQNSCKIATKTDGGQVHIFDYRKHLSEPPADGQCIPDLRLTGHSKGGFGLSWSSKRSGHLLSSSEDSKICFWDINVPSNNNELEATTKFKAHNGEVKDVAWLQNEHSFGSVGSDKCLKIWDLRAPLIPLFVRVAHQNEVNSISFNPFNERILVTGSADTTVKLFDLRNFRTAIHTFKSHNDVVNQVMWSPKNEVILASISKDSRVMLWDCSRVGDVQKPEKTKDDPPELLFTHVGHTSSVSELSWNPNIDWAIASVAADSEIQIWQIAESIYCRKPDIPDAESSSQGSS